MFTVYAADLTGLWIFLAVVGFFGVIAIVAFIIHISLRPKLKEEKKENTEEENAKEELDRILQPVEDDEVSQEIQEYKQNDDEEEE